MLIDRLSAGRPLRLAGPLTLPLVLVVLATAAGAVTGAFAGVRHEDLVFAARQLLWLAIVPLLVVNVVETERQVRGALAFGAGLRVLKAVLGLAGVAAGVGLVVEGATITYYEPTANWLVLLAILGRDRRPAAARPAAGLAAGGLAAAGAVARAVVPALVLDRRRARVRCSSSCSARGRPGARLAVIAGVLLAAAVWALSLQPSRPRRRSSSAPARSSRRRSSRTPRTATGSTSSRNVVAEIRRQPITGLGLGGPVDRHAPARRWSTRTGAATRTWSCSGGG